MKTKLFILIATGLLSLASKSQTSYKHQLVVNEELQSKQTTASNETLDTSRQIKRSKQELSPVYFSYRKRQLVYNGQRISGIDLVNRCRSIPDSLVQQQLNYYDQLTTRKKWILNATVFCGVNTFVMAAATSSTSQANSAFWASCALASGLASGITAICSSIPHQKRKIVMFKDLPIAYNHYVEMQNKKR